MIGPADLTLLTSADAASKLCPLARTFGPKKSQSGCRGPSCMAWRWAPLSSEDPRFKSAITREIMALRDADQKAGEKPRSDVALHKIAVAKVRRDPMAFTFPDEKDKGFCGIGGAP